MQNDADLSPERESFPAYTARVRRMLEEGMSA
jgi:hypothetical protein